MQDGPPPTPPPNHPEISSQLLKVTLAAGVKVHVSTIRKWGLQKCELHGTRAREKAFALQKEYQGEIAVCQRASS